MCHGMQAQLSDVASLMSKIMQVALTFSTIKLKTLQFCGLQCPVGYPACA